MAEQWPALVARGAKGEVPVLCPENTVRRVDRMMISGWRWHPTAIQIANRLKPHRPDHSLQQGGVDHLPASGALPCLECGQYPIRSVESSEEVRDGNTGANGIASLET